MSDSPTTQGSVSIGQLWPRGGGGGGGAFDQDTADARYVNVSGDTMTGTLTVPTLTAPVPTAVSFDSSSTTQNSTGGFVSVTLPASIAEGDLLLALFTQNDWSNSVTPPAGWAIPTSFGGWGSHVGNNGNGLVGGAWYYKIAAAGDAGSVSTWATGQQRMRISVLVFRNGAMPTQFIDGNFNLTIAQNALGNAIASNGLMIAANVQHGDEGVSVVTPGTMIAAHKAGTGWTDTHNSFWASTVTAGQQSPAMTFASGGTGAIFIPLNTSAAKIVATNNIDFGGNRGPVNIKTPTSSGDAATKGYTDARTPKIIVLGPADPVPAGTPAGTVIVRTT